ncbi:hypothetical protein N9D99_00030 [Gammaproteobacteria bacterium]|nr:hypothetical protein [Gammaproteobacteria bacterium]
METILDTDASDKTESPHAGGHTSSHWMLTLQKLMLGRIVARYQPEGPYPTLLCN